MTELLSYISSTKTKYFWYIYHNHKSHIIYKFGHIWHIYIINLTKKIKNNIITMFQFNLIMPNYLNVQQYLGYLNRNDVFKLLFIYFLYYSDTTHHLHSSWYISLKYLLIILRTIFSFWYIQNVQYNVSVNLQKLYEICKDNVSIWTSW